MRVWCNGNPIACHAIVASSILATRSNKFCWCRSVVDRHLGKMEVPSSSLGISTKQRSLTQWSRVPVFETGGRGFESLRIGQYNGVLSVVVCTAFGERVSMSSILIEHPKQFLPTKLT